MKKAVLMLSLLMITSVSYADLKKDSEKLCSKIKRCALIEIDKQGLPKESKDAVLNFFDNQCVNSVSKYQVGLDNVILQKKARQCLRSLNNQSCEQLVNTNESSITRACRDFETSAQKAGVNTSQPTPLR